MKTFPFLPPYRSTQEWKLEAFFSWTMVFLKVFSFFSFFFFLNYTSELFCEINCLLSQKPLLSYLITHVRGNNFFSLKDLLWNMYLNNISFLVQSVPLFFYHPLYTFHMILWYLVTYSSLVWLYRNNCHQAQVTWNRPNSNFCVWHQG